MQMETGETRDSGPVCLWRLPQGLSQSRIGGRKRRSYACTIIAIKLAQEVASAGSVLPRLSVGDSSGSGGKSGTKRKCGTEPPEQLAQLLRKRAKMSEGLRGTQEPMVGGEDSEPSSDEANRPTPMEDASPPPPAKTTSDDGGGCCLGTKHAVAANRRSKTRGKNHFKNRLRRVLGINTGKSGSSSSSSGDENPRLIQPPPALLAAMLRSLVNGNTLHDEAMRKMNRNPNNPNFNVPHAIQAVHNSVLELDWVVITGCFRSELERQLREGMGRWSAVMGKEDWSPTMTILVISNERTVLFLYQPKPAILGLMDSHSHGQHGALIAVCPANHLGVFCQWIYDVVFPDMPRDREDSQSFEVSLVLAYPPDVDENHDGIQQIKRQLHNSVFIKPPRRSARIAAASKSNLDKALKDSAIDSPSFTSPLAAPGKARIPANNRNRAAHGSDQGFFDQPLPNSPDGSFSSPASAAWTTPSPASWDNNNNASPASLSTFQGPYDDAPCANYLSYGGSPALYRASLGGGGGQAPQRRSPRQHRPPGLPTTLHFLPPDGFPPTHPFPHSSLIQHQHYPHDPRFFQHPHEQFPQYATPPPHQYYQHQRY